MSSQPWPRDYVLGTKRRYLCDPTVLCKFTKFTMVKRGHFFLITKYVCSRIAHSPRNFCFCCLLFTRHKNVCFWQTRLQIINNWKVVKICDKKHPLLIKALSTRILVVKDLGRRGGGYWLGGNLWQVLPFTSPSNPLAKSIFSLRPNLFCSLKSQNWNRSDFFSCKSGSFTCPNPPPCATCVI